MHHFIEIKQKHVETLIMFLSYKFFTMEQLYVERHRDNETDNKVALLNEEDMLLFIHSINNTDCFNIKKNVCLNFFIIGWNLLLLHRFGIIRMKSNIGNLLALDYRFYIFLFLLVLYLYSQICTAY